MASKRKPPKRKPKPKTKPREAQAMPVSRLGHLPKLKVPASSTPPWLSTMRAISGWTEVPGEADNPKIVGMAESIAQNFPEMESYCDQYQHDSTPWCGLTVAYCMSENDIRPVFGPTDTDKFLWAQAWIDWGFPIEPTPGCVMIFTREGGGHVTLLEEITSSGAWKCRGGNQSDMVNVATYTSGLLGAVWPPGYRPPVPVKPPMLEKGDTGRWVGIAQKLLNANGATPVLDVDSDFGPATDTATREFQRESDLTVDGVIGPDTWKALAAGVILPPDPDTVTAEEVVSEIMTAIEPVMTEILNKYTFTME